MEKVSIGGIPIDASQVTELDGGVRIGLVAEEGKSLPPQLRRFLEDLTLEYARAGHRAPLNFSADK
jgi:hypothetical protein